jgi:hypothetical protein
MGPLDHMHVMGLSDDLASLRIEWKENPGSIDIRLALLMTNTTRKQKNSASPYSKEEWKKLEELSKRKGNRFYSSREALAHLNNLKTKH